MPRDRIVIIGAGMGGLAAALLLGCRGRGGAGAGARGSPRRQDAAARHRRPGDRRRADGADHALGVRGALRRGGRGACRSRDARTAGDSRPPCAGARASGSTFTPISRPPPMPSAISRARRRRRRFLAFSAEARRIYETLERPFIRAQRPNPLKLATANGLSGLGRMARINPFETMWKGLGRHFRDPRLRQLFGRYATYCGSSPFLAPATLMLVAHVEQAGVWTVKGGMHELALAHGRARAQPRAWTSATAQEVTAIETQGGRVSAVRTARGGIRLLRRDRECRCECGGRGPVRRGGAARGGARRPRRSARSPPSPGRRWRKHRDFRWRGTMCSSRATTRRNSVNWRRATRPSPRSTSARRTARGMARAGAAAGARQFARQWRSCAADHDAVERAMRAQAAQCGLQRRLGAGPHDHHRPRALRRAVSRHGRRIVWEGLARMDGIFSAAGGGNADTGPLPGGGQRAPGAGRADGGTLRAAGGGKPDGVAGFDAAGSVRRLPLVVPRRPERRRPPRPHHHRLRRQRVLALLRAARAGGALRTPKITAR